ncbi:recombinase family protein [Streptomyces tsukubensis]|uniref:recombinase family protein n=1 Tax=Streptomyces tsukubensis TaxID=83656 RepID=UPI0034510411
MLNQTHVHSNVRAAGYDRQSESRASGSEASPVTQRKANHAEAAKRKMAIETQGGHFQWMGHYSERPGTSAFGKDERPEFERLIADCRAGKVNMIIVMYISRFSRLDPMEALAIVSELFSLGVTIVSVTEGEFRKGAILDLFHILMRLDQSHTESKNKSIAVSSAHQLTKELGGFVGKTPFGFKLRTVTVYYMEQGKPKPIDIQLLDHNDDEFEGGWSEKETIQHVWRTIQENKDKVYNPKVDSFHPASLNHLCDWLDIKGVPTRGQRVGKRKTESKWDVSTLRRILSDPLIAGMDRKVIYGTRADGTSTGKAIGYEIKRDPETMEPIELECGEMVPRNEWYDLQPWLSQRGRGKGLYNGESLLTSMDILWCECDWYMVSGGHERVDEYKMPPYRCKRKKSQRKAPHHTGDNTIAKHRLDDLIARSIFALIATAEGDDETSDILHEATRRFAATQEKPENSEERKSLLRQRETTTKALNALYNQFDQVIESGGFPNEIAEKRYKATEKNLSERLSATNTRLAELDEIDSPTLPIEQWTSAYDESGAIKDHVPADPIGENSWWGKASMKEKRELVQIFVRRITVGRNYGKGSSITPPEKRVKIEWVHTEKYVS